MTDQITPILMPKWGLSMKEGKLAAWHVTEGTMISPGDEIMDVETDKIANAVEAADGGLLRRRVGQEGETYPVRALLAVMAPDTVSEAVIDAYVAGFAVPMVEGEGDTGPAYDVADLPIGRIRYTSRPGTGTPVILIHGFGGDLDNWLFNIDALAEEVPVHALDLPGHGQSVKAVDNPGLGTMVATLVAFMDHLGIARAHLVGHSMGGLIAGQLAVDDPARVASVTLICTAGLGAEINGGYIDGFVSASGRKDLRPVLGDLFHDQTLVSRSMVEDLLKYKRLDGVQAFLAALKANLFAGGRQAVRISDRLAESTVPCLIIWGAGDAIIPVSHSAAVAGATVAVIEGAGHMVQMEQAARVNDLIKARL
jgi:pyruvate dehydrogenase E2 component (dihydrolipoamide acetyltransferase)